MEYIAASRPDYAHVARRLKGKVNPGYLRVGAGEGAGAPLMEVVCQELDAAGELGGVGDHAEVAEVRYHGNPGNLDRNREKRNKEDGHEPR